MKSIHFIVNPIAGSGNNHLNLEMLNAFFDSARYILKLKYSDFKKHAEQLTLESISEGAHVIVACGGDGTVNEVASCLVGTTIILGIIPLGSGNGLASHLRIPKNMHEAIQLIKNENVIQIDVGSINSSYFFSNTGSGFDAQVIRNYEESKDRRFISYLRATYKTLKELNTKSKINEISINDKTKLVNPFMVFVSNSNELGYHVSLTPKASIQDGMLDMIIVPKLGRLKMFLFGILILFKKHHLLKEVTTYQDKNLTIKQKKGSIFQTQIDGEAHTINDHEISISVLEKSLSVIS